MHSGNRPYKAAWAYDIHIYPYGSTEFSYKKTAGLCTSYSQVVLFSPGLVCCFFMIRNRWEIQYPLKSFLR